MSAEVSILPARILREVSVTFTILRRIPFAHLRLRRQAPDATTPTPRFRGRIPRKTGHLCDVFSFSDAVLVCPAIGSGDNDDQSNFSRLHFLTNHTPPVPPVCVVCLPPTDWQRRADWCGGLPSGQHQCRERHPDRCRVLGGDGSA